MALELNLNNVQSSFYKYPLRNGQYIPIITIEAPFTLQQFRDNHINVEGTFNDLYNNINVPVWFYQPIAEKQYYTYLEIYQDKKIHVSTAIGRYNQMTLTVALYSQSGDLYASIGTISYIRDSNYLSVILYFLHFTDDKYIIIHSSKQGGFCAANFNSELVSNIVPDKAKGLVNSANIPTPQVVGIFNNDDDTLEFKYLTNGLHPTDFNDPNDGGGSSQGGGGGGDGDIGGDTNDDDGLPTLSALDSGLLTAYNPKEADLQALGRFLWSDSFDVNSFKKLFNDPFDTLLGLSVIPIKPNTSGTKNIMFGNLDSGVSAPVVSSQWVSKDMGSLTLNEVWKGALDYSPSTGVSIYLPFIGMRQLNVNDVMGSTLHLMYKFDVLTGTCVAQIYVNHNAQGNKGSNGFSYTKNQGLVYEFMGQCSVNIPLASQDFTNTIRAAISAVGMAAGAAASIATGNPALGIASLTVGAANAGMQANTPTVERSGHLSGSGAILGYYQPFLVVERPHQCKPQRYYALRGIPSQVYVSKLAECTGFTQITDNNNIHASGAQDTELEEIERLLTSGVYFPDKKRS